MADMPARSPAALVRPGFQATLTGCWSTAIPSPLTTVCLGANPVGRTAFALLLAALAGCVSLPSLCPPRTSMKLHFDNEAMHAEVLKYLSVGMPIENARRIME